MKTSLILCTKNGGARLRTCLAHLDAVDADADFEIILVDNGSDDGVSASVLTDYARASRHRCRLIRCLRPGNSAGRNDGIRIAEGDLLIFIDDDCYADPGLVRAWREIFTVHDVGYASGMVLRHDSSASMLGCRETTDILLMPAGELVEPGFVKGSNMAFRRSCFERIGLFDERMGSGVPFAGEDWDIALRLSFAGFAGGYFPAPKVSHDHQRVGINHDSRLDFYEYGNGAVFAKHMRGRHFARLWRRFVRQLRRLRATPRRLLTFLRGYWDFTRLSSRNGRREYAL
jgi:glycosyltransferase involved in cell wall biosynthesis